MLDKAVHLNTLHEEIRGMGTWKRTELKLLRVKTVPLSGVPAAFPPFLQCSDRQAGS